MESGTYYAARAAYVRLTHAEVVEALAGARAGVPGPLARLNAWVPEAERYPPRPDSDPRRVGEGSGRTPRGQHSKRCAAAAMPSGWLEELWEIAVTKRFAYLDARAALICTGARPSEVCLGVAARAAGEGGLMVVVAGTKVSATMGQPWRKLSMVADTDAARHILGLAEGFPDGVARINPTCTPGVLSDAIADLAGNRWVSIFLPRFSFPFRSAVGTTWWQVRLAAAPVQRLRCMRPVAVTSGGGGAGRPGLRHRRH